GKRRLDAWLRTPVSHLRDVRNELMLKLAFLTRMHRSPAKLVDGQLRKFAALLRALERAPPLHRAFTKANRAGRAAAVDPRRCEPGGLRRGRSGRVRRGSNAQRGAHPIRSPGRKTGLYSKER